MLFSLFRSLIIYGIVLPLAIFIGYLLATPTDLTTYGSLALLLLLLTLPLFLRFHYPWLVFSWNTIAGLYFLPGKPSFSLLMIFISFGFSFLAYIMNRDLKFISVPSITRPLLFIGLVVYITARFNGGIGLNILGAESSGGKRYIFILSAIVGYYALTAQLIPTRKAIMYVNLFFSGYITSAIGTIFAYVIPSFYIIALIFPSDLAGQTFGRQPHATGGITRLGGLSLACIGAIQWLLARFGITGILDMRKAWRLLLVIALCIVSLFGGFRSKAIEVALTFAVLFYLEGLMRSKLLPVVILLTVLSAALVVPFADKLPLSVQRSLTFLPLKLDMEAELNAQASTDWRLQIWANVIPTIPQYLLLGKGLAMDARDLDMMRSLGLGHSLDSGSGNGAALAGDYHSGPLSVIIPFGLPGVFGFVWFLIAGFRALYRNNKYGDPAYGTVNRFLLTFFIVKLLMFLFIVGSLYSDLVMFTGVVGFSVALNGGILNPTVETIARPYVSRFKLANAVR